MRGEMEGMETFDTQTRYNRSIVGRFAEVPMLAAQFNSALINGLVPLAFGVYTTLLGYGVVPANPGNPQKSSAWRARHASKAKLGGPILIVFGVFMCSRAIWGGW